MFWVTRPHVGPDRVACAWLIQTWLDPRATLRYLDEPDLTRAVRAGALPFHTTTAEVGEWDERTAFCALLTEYQRAARDPALERLARLVQQAEAGTGAATLPARRLAAVLGHLHTAQMPDAAIVEQLAPLFDTLYRRYRRGACPRAGPLGLAGGSGSAGRPDGGTTKSV